MEETLQTGMQPGATQEVRAPAEGFSRVVVGTDFSPRAACALTRVSQLRLARGAVVQVAHIVPPEVVRAPFARGEEAVDTRHLVAAALTVRRRLEPGAQVEVWPVLQEGTPPEALAALAGETRAELVVLGRASPRAHRWGRQSGVSPEGLLQRMEASLLLVAPGTARPYRRPLVAVDLSPVSHRALALALRLCPAASHVTVLHVCDSAYEMVLHATGAPPERVLHHREAAEAEARAALARLLAPLQGRGPRLVPEVLSGEPGRALLAAAAASRADLTVLGAPGRGRAARQLAHGVAGVVLRHAKGDVALAR